MLALKKRTEICCCFILSSILESISVSKMNKEKKEERKEKKEKEGKKGREGK